MKYYFFRDTDNESNLLDGKTYHAAGYVEKLFCELGKPNRSGKDLAVSFFEPFQGTITSAWRALDEVELFEVAEWEYVQLVKSYDAIKQFKRGTKPKLSTKPFIGFMWCYRQFFPVIKFVDEIPQWIISSNIAAYHPYSKTIYIRNNLGFKTIPILLHELSHWFIHIFLNNNQKLHNKIDKK